MVYPLDRLAYLFSTVEVLLLNGAQLDSELY